MFSAFSPHRRKIHYSQGFVRLPVNATPSPVLKKSVFCINFCTHGRETLRKEIGAFLNWKPDNYYQTTVSLVYTDSERVRTGFINAGSFVFSQEISQISKYRQK
jgi:hypothetical protein